MSRCYTQCPDGYGVDGVVCRPTGDGPVVAAAATTPAQLGPLITDPQNQRVGTCAGGKHACIASRAGPSPVGCLNGASCQEQPPPQPAWYPDPVGVAIGALFVVLLVVLIVGLIVDMCRPRMVYVPADR